MIEACVNGLQHWPVASLPIRFSLLARQMEPVAWLQVVTALENMLFFRDRYITAALWVLFKGTCVDQEPLCILHPVQQYRL